MSDIDFIYTKLDEAETAIDAGDKGEDFFAFAEYMREKIIKKLIEREVEITM